MELGSLALSLLGNAIVQMGKSIGFNGINRSKYVQIEQKE